MAAWMDFQNISQGCLVKLKFDSDRILRQGHKTHVRVKRGIIIIYLSWCHYPNSYEHFFKSTYSTPQSMQVASKTREGYLDL